jgi:hypothetical protein
MYFFANNYVDGASRAVATTYNISQIMVGNKDFDPRTDTYFLDSYLKAPSNYDAIQFSKAEKTEEIQRRRFKRKRESGYSGAGFWFANYPYMIGAMSSGTDPREGTIPGREQGIRVGLEFPYRRAMGANRPILEGV